MTGQLDQHGVTASTVLEASSIGYRVRLVPWSFEILEIFRAFYSWQLYIWLGLHVENSFTASLTLVSKCNMMQGLTLLPVSPKLFLLAAVVILPVSQQDAHLHWRRRAVFQNWTLSTFWGWCWAWLGDASEHLLAHREDLSLECRIMLHFGRSQHLPCLFKPCFPSPRFMHLVLIKRKKASRVTGVAAVSHEARVLGFF